jgi:hypothetical protein
MISPFYLISMRYIEVLALRKAGLEAKICYMMYSPWINGMMLHKCSSTHHSNAISLSSITQRIRHRRSHLQQVSDTPSQTLTLKSLDGLLPGVAILGFLHLYFTSRTCLHPVVLPLMILQFGL